VPLSSNAQVREDDGTTVLQSVVIRLPSVAASHKNGKANLYSCSSKTTYHRKYSKYRLKNHLAEAQENFSFRKTDTECSKLHLESRTGNSNYARGKAVIRRKPKLALLPGYEFKNKNNYNYIQKTQIRTVARRCFFKMERGTYAHFVKRCCEGHGAKDRSLY